MIWWAGFYATFYYANVLAMDIEAPSNKYVSVIFAFFFVDLFERSWHSNGVGPRVIIRSKR